MKLYFTLALSLAISTFTYANRINTATATTVMVGATSTNSYNGNDANEFEFVANQATTTIEVQGLNNFDAVVTVTEINGRKQKTIVSQDNTYSGATESIALTNLVAGKQYYVSVSNYIKADIGQFTLAVNDVVAITPPTNDEPANAIDLTVTPAFGRTKHLPTQYSTVGATFNNTMPVPANCADANLPVSDVWFKIKVPASGIISVNPRNGNTTNADGSIALYTGTPSALNLVAAIDDDANSLNPSLTQTGLTPNTYVYVRAWSNARAQGGGGIGVLGGDQSGSDCNNSLDICDFAGGVSGGFSSGNGVTKPCGLEGNQNGGVFGSCSTGQSFGTGCGGSAVADVTIDRNLWLRFTAESPNISLTLTTSACSNTGLAGGVQMQIFSATSACCNFSAESDFIEPAPNSSGTLTASGLTPGASYYLMIDAWGSNLCDFEITGGSGVNLGDIIATPTTVCAGGSATLNPSDGANTYTWTADNGPDPASNGELPITVTPTVTTTYTVTMTGYCNNTITSSVTVNVGGGDVTITPAATTACKTGTETYSVTPNSGSTYAWTVTGGTPASGSGSSINVTWGSGATGSISVTETTADGCTGTDAVNNITLSNVPTAGFSYPNSPICDDALLLPYTLAPGATAGDFTVSQFGVLHVNGDVTPFLTPAFFAPGTYTMTNTVSAPGCPVVTATADFTLNPTPKPVITTSNTTVCKNDVGTYSIQAATPATSTIAWVVTGGTIATGAGTTSITVNWTTVGTGTVDVTVTNTYGCVGTDNVSVTVNPLPTAFIPTITPGTTICSGNTITITAAPQAGVTSSVYTTPTGGAAIGTVNFTSPVLTTPLLPTTIIYYIETRTTAGCMLQPRRDSVIITVNPTPDPKITTTAGINICNVDTSTYSVTPTIHTTLWAVSGGNINSGQGTSTIDAIWSTPGPAFVTVKETNIYTCVGNDTTFLTVNPLPTAFIPTVTANDTICSGNAITISATPQPDVISTVYPTLTGGTALGTVNFTSPVLTTDTNVKILTYYIETKTSFGCVLKTSRDSVKIRINPLPLAPILSYMPNDSICFGNVDTLKVVGIPGRITNVFGTATGGTSLGALNWVTPPIVNNIKYYFETKMIATGCLSSQVRDSVLITMVPRPARPILTLAPNDTICKLDSIKFKATVTGPYQSIKWYTTSVSATSIGNDSIKVSPPATQHFYCEVKNSFGCKADEKRDSIKVTVLPLPDLPILTAPLIEICENDSIVLKATVKPTTATIFWLDGTTWNDTIKRGPDFTSPNLFASTTYYMGSISKDGCKNEGAFTALPVVVKITPHVTITSSVENNTSYIDQSLTFTATPSIYDSYTWYIDKSQITVGNNIFETQDIKNNQIVKVLVIENGCPNWGDNEIVNKVLPVSNAFTPNSDGKNDLFLKGLDLKIFNRWGQLLFTGNEGWDGKYKGNVVSPGTYYYMIKTKKLFSEEVIEKSGSVTVVLD